MNIDQLDPGRFRAHESAIRETLSDLPVEFKRWDFCEADCRLDVIFTYQLAENIDSTVIYDRIHDCFWQLPVFRHKRSARGIEAPLLHHMKWSDDPNLLSGVTEVRLADGEYHDVGFDLHIEKLDGSLEDTLAGVRRFFVTWSDHDRRIKRMLAADLPENASTRDADRVSLVESMLPSHMTFYADSTVAVRYPGGESYAGKDVVSKLSLEGIVLETGVAKPRKREEASKRRTLPIFFWNIDGHMITVSPTGGKTVEVSFTSAGLTEARARERMPQFVAQLEALPITDFVVECSDGDISVVATYRLPPFLPKYFVHRIVKKIVHLFERTYGNRVRRLRDPVLGSLTWKNRYKHFEGRCTLGGEPEVSVYLRDWGEQPVQVTLRRARDIVDRWDEWIARVRPAIISELLPLHNDQWRTVGAALDASAFLARLSVCSLSIDDNNCVSIHFDADDMFMEHAVDVRISPDDQISVGIA